MQNQTISNLVTAGVLLQREAEHFSELLSALTMRELALALLESHQLREDCPNPINYHPIGEISKN